MNGNNKLPRFPPINKYQVGDVVKITHFGNNKWIIVNVDVTGIHYMLKHRTKMLKHRTKDDCRTIYRRVEELYTL